MEYLDLILTGLIASVSSVVISEVYHRRSMVNSKKSIARLREDTDKFRDNILDHIQSIDTDFPVESQLIINNIQQEIRQLDRDFGSKRIRLSIIGMLAIYFVSFFIISFFTYSYTGNPVFSAIVLLAYCVLAKFAYDFFSISPLKKEIMARYEKFADLMHEYKISFNEKASIEKWIARSEFDYLDQNQMLRILTRIPIYAVVERD